jgi:DNA-directed RNA polymerase subunit RPC12/RpoP
MRDRTKIIALEICIYPSMNQSEDLEEKKLLGSGGYVFAKLTEQEEIKASVGVPHIFLGNVGRLNEDRFTKYYCNKCAKEYPGSPAISYENPNEELGEDVILIEKGEYRCRTCNSVIALYRKFNK